MQGDAVKFRNYSVSKQPMWICCAFMLLSVSVYLVMLGAALGWQQTALSLALFLACFGVHIVLRRIAGKPRQELSASRP